MSAEKYRIEDEGVSRASSGDLVSDGSGGGRCDQIRQNLSTLNCEISAPEKSHLIYFTIAAAAGSLAIIIGVFTGRATIQGMKDYNIYVKSKDNGTQSMINVLTVFQVAALYLPGGNFASLSDTQTIQDFESSWTATLHIPAKLCFLQPMNKTEVDTFNNYKKALTEGDSYVLNTVEIPTTIGYEVRDALDKEIAALTPYVRGRCQENRILRIVKTGLPSIGDNCTESYLPEYALRPHGGKQVVQIVDVKMVPVDCSTPS